MLIMACIRKNIHKYSFKSQPLCTEICLELLEHVKIFGVLMRDVFSCLNKQLQGVDFCVILECPSNFLISSLGCE